MSTAAINLQCPNCGGVFLTLQESTGGIEICPHCAISAPRTSYRALPDDFGVPRWKTELPARRLDMPPSVTGSLPLGPMANGQNAVPSQTSKVNLSAFGSQLAKPPAATGKPLLPPEDAPFPQAPEQGAAPYALWQAALGQLQGKPVPPSGPLPPSAATSVVYLSSTSPAAGAKMGPAPEPPAMQSFMTTHPPAAALVTSSMPVALPPPQIGFATGQPVLPPSQWVVVPASPLPLPNSWSGVGVEVPTVGDAEAPSGATLAPEEKTVVNVVAERIPSKARGARDFWEGNRQVPWGAVLFFLALTLALGWWIWQAAMPIAFPAGLRPLEEPGASSHRERDTTGADAAPVPPLVDGEYAALWQAGKEVLRALDAAGSSEERLKWIAAPGNDRAEVDRFFSAIGGTIGLIALEPSPGLVLDFSTGERIRLLRAVTAKCPSGAIVRLHTHEGNFAKLDWPLFAQTHDYAFDSFARLAVTDKAAAQGQWFTLLCRRTRASVDSGLSDAWEALDVQGSLSAAGTVKAVVARDSEAGRVLLSQLAPGRACLVRLRLARLEVDGKPTTVVLECAGAPGLSAAKSRPRKS
ncbi:MAG: hypothetical protein ACOYMN_02675 [Roseimicrobium sp.]